MKKSNLPYLLLLVVLFTTTSHATVPEWVQLRSLSTSENSVPMATIRTIADSRARSLCARVSPGDAVPYSDLDGNLIAVMFHYRIDGLPFPDFASAASDVANETPLIAQNSARSRYFHVLASTRDDRAPILRYGEGGAELLLTLDDARTVAADLLVGNPNLTCIYYEWPLTFYQFEVGNRSVIIDAHTLRQRFAPSDFRNWILAGREQTERLTSGDVCALRAECAGKMRAEWRRLLTEPEAFDETTAVYVPDVQLAPFYDWSYGCSPTSGTMVVGYLDAARGYGRCIYDFFTHWDGVEGEKDYNTPWAQKDMAICFRTDTMSGGTYANLIGPGLEEFGALRDYPWEIFNAYGAGYSDWCWPSDSDEVSNGYPYVWSAIWAVHSLAAFGVRMPTKDIYVHNTWWAPAEWWHYTDGNYNSYAYVASVHPVGGSEVNVKLLTPRGDIRYNSNGAGERFWVGEVNRIRWDNFGHHSDSISIDLSCDAGWTWQELAHGLPDSGFYDWDIPRSVSASPQSRLRLRSFSGGQYLAGDGSYGNFYLATAPLPPSPRLPVNGQQVRNPPVTLVISQPEHGDSVNFVLYNSTDTLYRYCGLDTTCTPPDSLFQYRRVYNWACRAHNSFGWGEHSTPWSFWAMFNQGVADESNASPIQSALSAPSISRPAFVVRFSLSHPDDIRLDVYDATGRPVRNLVSGRFGIGNHSTYWGLDNASRGVASGCYFIRLTTQGSALVRPVRIVVR